MQSFHRLYWWRKGCIFRFAKEVQDTLIWWGEHTIISIDDTVYVELPDIICYKSDYSFLRSTFGPWIISRRIKRNSDGREWRFSGRINIPTPIVAIGDTIYIPSEYNLVVSAGVDSNAVFIRQILRWIIIEMFIRSWSISIILHLGTGGRYWGCGCSVAGRKCHAGSAMVRKIPEI